MAAFAKPSPSTSSTCSKDRISIRRPRRQQAWQTSAASLDAKHTRVRRPRHTLAHGRALQAQGNRAPSSARCAQLSSDAFLCCSGTGTSVVTPDCSSQRPLAADDTPHGALCLTLQAKRIAPPCGSTTSRLAQCGQNMLPGNLRACAAPREPGACAATTTSAQPCGGSTFPLPPGRHPEVAQFETAFMENFAPNRQWRAMLSVHLARMRVTNDNLLRWAVCRNRDRLSPPPPPPSPHPPVSNMKASCALSHSLPCRRAQEAA